MEEDKIQDADEDYFSAVTQLTLPDRWNEGKIEVNINRCCDCYYHFNYSRHSEDEYISMFNDIGDAVLTLFPNANIIGNYEKP